MFYILNDDNSYNSDKRLFICKKVNIVGCYSLLCYCYILKK